jgi:hypothetical protein
MARAKPGATWLLAACLLPAAAWSQQLPDRGFRPAIAAPRFEAAQGPVVCVDEAHFNFHTLPERFFAFGELLRRDGYQVRPSTGRLDAATLAPCRVLVISNAQPNGAGWNQYPYPTPSAFTKSEIEAVRRWVADGRSLLLIADHMPLAGAAADLAAAFEVRFFDGFAMRETEESEPDLFTTVNGGLTNHPITRGRRGEAVTSVRTFTGQAFQAPGAEPLLVFPPGYVMLMPERAWQFAPDTRRVSVEGWLQGAVRTVDKGRAAFFGEAAMFTAQLAGPEQEPVGMNSPGAEQNHRFVLNLMHWLSESPQDAT